MRWRFIPFSYQTASMNMGIDEAISEFVASKQSPPTIRIYGWKPSAITIGQFQNLQSEVDTETCKDLGVDVVRRRTGGGAVYHDQHGEVTYSVIAPESEVATDINEAYREICSRITVALYSLGIESHFRPINDIVVNGRKISGSAQTRRGGAFLQHGTILYALDRSRMFSLLKVPLAKLVDKGVSNPLELVTCVRENCDSSMDELISELEISFSSWVSLSAGTLDDRELERAIRLANERYSSNEWNQSR